MVWLTPKQTRLLPLLNTGFTTFNSGDGVTLFNTAHPTVEGSTNANRPATDADLNETSLEQAVIDIAAFTDERGLLIAARPRKVNHSTSVNVCCNSLVGNNSACWYSR